MQKRLKRILYLRNYEELSPCIIQKSLGRASVAHVKNLVLYLKNQELSPGVRQKSLAVVV